MKALKIEIEFCITKEHRSDFIDYKNIKVQTAISKLIKKYPEALIYNINAKYY